MRAFASIGTAVLFVSLGAVVPAFASQEHKEGNQEQKQPQQQQQHAQSQGQQKQSQHQKQSNQQQAQHQRFHVMPVAS